MHRLLEPVDLYDVLGLAPDARDSEIVAEFDWLIARKGYRLGMPRRDWPERVRQIKAAYATLGDPVKRRAYDVSLREAPASPLRVASGTDAATDMLVRPARNQQSHGPAANDEVTGAATTPGRAELDSAAVEQVTESTPVAPSKMAPEPEQHEAYVDAGGSSEDERPAMASPSADPRQPDNEEFESTPGEHFASWRGSSFSRRARRSPAREVGLAAAVIAALGTILYASWPDTGLQSINSDRTQPPTVAAAKDGVVGLPPEVASVGDSSSEAGAEQGSEEEPISASDLAAASTSLSNWFDFGGGARDQAAAPDANEVPSAEAQAPSPAGSPPAGSASTAQQTAGQAGLAQAGESVPSGAQARPSDAAGASPTVTVTVPETYARPATAEPPGAKTISSPSALISGGPTGADNRRGRYQGSVTVQFTVSAEGRVSNCTPVRSSADPKLDALTCRLLVQRALFKPARDAQGRAVASDAHATYNWSRGSPRILRKVTGLLKRIF